MKRSDESEPGILTTRSTVTETTFNYSVDVYEQTVTKGGKVMIRNAGSIDIRTPKQIIKPGSLGIVPMSAIRLKRDILTLVPTY